MTNNGSDSGQADSNSIDAPNGGDAPRPRSITEVMAAIRSGDWEVIDDLSAAPAQWVETLRAELPSLDRDSLELAIACLEQQADEPAGELLLQLAQQDNVQLAAQAAQGLLAVEPLPAATTVLQIAAQCEEPFVRGTLYLAAGRAGAGADLAVLHEAGKEEDEPVAQLRYEAAAAVLGGDEEREKFIATIAAADPEVAEQLCGLLVYTADPRLTEGLLPWLADETVVLFIDPEGDAATVTMADLAVKTAQALGVYEPPDPDEVYGFNEAVRGSVRHAIQNLSAERR